MSALAFLVGDRVLPFPSESFLLGSGAGCALRLSALEPRHAEVFLEDETWLIRDISGTSTLRVNGVATLEAKIDAGSHINLGSVKLTVRGKAPVVEDQTFIPTSGGVLMNGLVIDGRYQVLGKIAAGGMGAVYLVEHLELSRKFAMKVMLPELSRDQDFVGRFKREAIASSRIGQQNIIDISDFGRTADGRFYFVMEFVDGKTLIKHRKEGPFPFQRVVHVGLQIARALAAAHAVNIVHRDLKPENIMLVQRPGQPDFVKVLDFGIAKVINNAGTGAAFTAIGSVVGTPQYMAPEQAGGLPVDARSDIYSMGLILHELVRGKPTFVGDSAVELMSMQLAKPAPALTSPHGPVPRGLEQLIGQMLQKAPENRPASMEAVVAGLEAVAAYPTPTAKTAPMPLPAVTRMEVLKEPVIATSAGILTPSIPGVPQVEDPMATGIGALRQVTVKPPPTARVAPLPREDSAVDLEAVRPSRTPLLVGGLVVLVALLAGALVVLGLPGSEKEKVVVAPPVEPVPVPKPEIVEAPKPVEVVKIVLETTPPHAEVYEDDVMLGSTPMALSRPPGTLTSVRFEAKGFQPLAKKVRFESDTTLRLELQKEAGKGVSKKPGKPRPPGDDDLMDLPE